jgi:hypothetical protein
MADHREWQHKPVENRWPRWLHFGCLGCSAVVALAAIVTAVSIAFWAHQSAVGTAEALSASRHVPMRALDNGCIASLRAEGYTVTQAAYLPSGGIVAVGVPAMDMGKVFGSAMSGMGNPKTATGSVFRLMASRLVLVGPHGPEEVPPPPAGEDYAAGVDSFCLDPSGSRLMAQVALTDLYDTMADRREGEVWLLDIAARKWSRLLRLSATEGQRVRFLAWLPGRDAVLAVPMRLPGGKQPELWLIDTDGKVRTIPLPSPARQVVVQDTQTFRVSPDGASVALASLAPGREAKTSGAQIITVDIATGKAAARPVTSLPATHPGPLSRDESLVAVASRLGALDWRAARLRFLTWPMFGLGKFCASPDGAWAFADVVPRKGGKRTVVAVNLADGRAHLVLSHSSATPLAAGSGCSFLASLRDSSGSPFAGETAELLEVYEDSGALARSPVAQGVFAGSSEAPAPAAGAT